MVKSNLTNSYLEVSRMAIDHKESDEQLETSPKLGLSLILTLCLGRMTGDGVGIGRMAGF